MEHSIVSLFSSCHIYTTTRPRERDSTPPETPRQPQRAPEHQTQTRAHPDPEKTIQDQIRPPETATAPDQHSTTTRQRPTRHLETSPEPQICPIEPFRPCTLPTLHPHQKRPLKRKIQPQRAHQTTPRHPERQPLKKIL